MTNQPQPHYVVASSRPWNQELAARLRARSGRPFALARSLTELDQALSVAPDPRFVFFPHWSERIPARIWKHHAAVIFHMTEVPYGVGGSPLQNLIVRSHSETVVSAFRCVEQIDAGPVYLRRPLALYGSAEEILIRADGVIEEMILAIAGDEPAPVPQQGDRVVFARRTPTMSAITPDMTLERLYDHIRMLDAEDYPPAHLDVGDLRFEFSRVGRRADRLEAAVVIRPRPQESE